MDYTVISLGEILSDEYGQTKIENSFKEFSCSREKDLEDFLMNKAIPYELSGYGKTYLCLDSQALEHALFKIVAYFTIAQKSVDISVLSSKQKRKMLGSYPGRDSLTSVAAYLIGQLGRCDQYSSTDLSGTQLLNECYHAISMAAKAVGGNLLILECREHMFDKFYKNEDFKKLYNEVSAEGLYTLYKRINFEEYWNGDTFF